MPLKRFEANKVLALLMLLFFPAFVNGQGFSLANAFAHNDYRHKRPLIDAQTNGYTHIEADVFLHQGKLVVAHINPFFKGNRTLEKLYLAPLAKQAGDTDLNLCQTDNKPITLLVDIKTDAKKTYAALKPLLEKYRSILSSYDSGRVIKRAVTIVLSGHKPYNEIIDEKFRLAFIDEDLRKVDRDTVAHVSTMASCKYSKLIKWKGNGSMPYQEKERLLRYVNKAHSNGDQVRLWASPDNQRVWKEILNCGVDLINTDKLVALKNFLVAQSRNN